MASCSCLLVHMKGSSHMTHFTNTFEHLKLMFSSSVVTLSRTFQNNGPVLQINNSRKQIQKAPARWLLDVFVDLMYQFVDEPLLPSQSNFAPVEEIPKPIHVTTVEGQIPTDFLEGVYIRNGPNPCYGGLKSAVSAFGKTSSVWVEGEGMLHAVYFKKDSAGNWTNIYNNKYVETTSYLLEKEKNKPSFLPAVEGDPSAVISSFVLNSLRFGVPNKQYSNTNVIEHAGKFYSIAENHVPHEIDIRTLETLGDWTIGGAWTRPFTSHPKKVPGTGELVMMGFDGKKPYYELGVISADGKKLIHKVDLKFDRSVISHDIGITQRYNVVLDFPVIVDINRVMKGGPLIKYEKHKSSRIGIMPRYGCADSVHWFLVKPSCAYHLINCFEDGDDDEVVVIGCKAQEAIIPGPELGMNKFEWFSRGLKQANMDKQTDHDGKLLPRVYEWRLNMKTGEVKEGYLTGTNFALEFPMINPEFTGLKNKYAYALLVDSPASSTAGLPKYSGLAKLYLQEKSVEFCMRDEDAMKAEYHMFPANTFCSGAAFVAKSAAAEEDDGWIIAFVHNEDSDTSQVHIVDCKELSGEAVAKLALPCRVPYGFHAIFGRTS